RYPKSSWFNGDATYELITGGGDSATAPSAWCLIVIPVGPAGLLPMQVLDDSDRFSQGWPLITRCSYLATQGVEQCSGGAPGVVLLASIARRFGAQSALGYRGGAHGHIRL